MGPITKCPTCGKEFEFKQWGFCSKECHREKFDEHNANVQKRFDEQRMMALDEEDTVIESDRMWKLMFKHLGLVGCDFLRHQEDHRKVHVISIHEKHVGDLLFTPNKIEFIEPRHDP